MPPTHPYLDRYLAGEHEQVWADLLALGPAVRDEPVYSDALAVARETMRRVRHNIELLIPRLRDIGYPFYRYGVDVYTGLSPDEAAEMHRLGPVHGSPAADVRDTIAAIEQKVGGPLPLSLRAFYEVVGTVNLTGRHPEWRISPYSLDALEVHSAEVALEGCDEWGPEEIMGVPIAPDEYFKDGYGGAGPYIVRLPDPAADAPLLWERHDTTFVNYLRICFRWGGFPGLERAPNPPLSDLAYLTKDLLPI